VEKQETNSSDLRFHARSCRSHLWDSDQH